LYSKIELQIYSLKLKKSTIIFVINPVAGNKKKIDKKKIEDRFAEREVVFIEDLKERELKIKEYINSGVRDFVAVGGDGTVNDVASILVNTPARLGIIPAGSGNGLARDLELPMTFESALDLIKSGNERKIDVGILNNKPFFCTAGIGFDAVCAYDFATKKHGRGLWNYVKIILTNYFSYKPVRLKLNGVESEVFSMTFANARQFGNNAFIAPQARPDDGFIDCAMIVPHPVFFALSIGLSLMNGNLDKSKYYKTQRQKTYSLSDISDRRIHLDGESVVLQEDNINVSILEGALNVIVS
jgi:diacylglycerol kinase (ATP)